MSRALVVATLVLVGLATTSTVRADVKLPTIFGDHMVVQHASTIAVWGWASRGEAVTVRTSWGSTAKTTADSRRRWSVKIDTPLTDHEKHEIVVEGHTTVKIRDVLLGEVWLCSGQSNMEMPVGDKGGGYRGAENYESVLAAADRPTIRFFTVRNTLSAANRSDLSGRWSPCTPETAHDFSAVGYFFAVDLQRELDVPIGVISADWGGTRAEAWMSPEAVEAFPEFEPGLEFLEMARDPNRRGAAQAERMASWWQSRIDSRPLRGKWATAGFDDSDWSIAPLPSNFDGDLEDFDGIVYYRKTVELSDDVVDRAATLSLGPIDDYDDAYVNGVHVGSEHGAGNWNKPRRYEIPAGTLKAGRNVIAVRVFDNAGLGGLNGRPEQLQLEIEDSDPIALAGEWRRMIGLAKSALPRRPEGAGLNKNMPTVLYRGMIHPLLPFTISGVIWYQGEGNRGRPKQYASLFPALIEDWRVAFINAELPFYFVQIAPFAYGGDKGQTAKLREAQQAALKLDRTGMAVTLDIGNPRDIHPNQKREVGNRLARLALADVYERDIVAHGPVFERAEFDGGSARVHFDHATTLRISGKGSEFELAGPDRVFHPAAARIDGETIVVQSRAVTESVAVRYAWRAAPSAQLFGADDLPAAPFRSDDWD